MRRAGKPGFPTLLLAQPARAPCKLRSETLPFTNFC